MTYRVSFDLAGNPWVNSESGPLTKTLKVEAAGQSQFFSFTTTPHTPFEVITNMGWQQQTWTFSAVAALTVLKFQGTNQGTGGPALDNVIVTQQAVVPAPAELQISPNSQLQIKGTVGAIYRVDFSSELPATNWFTMVTNFFLPTSPYTLTNVFSPNLPKGFYRAVGIQ